MIRFIDILSVPGALFASKDFIIRRKGRSIHMGVNQYVLSDISGTCMIFVLIGYRS